MSQIPPSSPRPGGRSPASPQPGWHPDPTGRHEHRYWDGAGWTEHVADTGVESVDPLTATPPVEGTPMGGTPVGGTSVGGAPAGGPFIGVPYTPQPPPSSPGRPPRTGPSPGLLVAVGVLAAALIVAVVVVATRDDGDGDTTTTATTQSASDDPTSTTTEDASDDTSESAVVAGLAAGVYEGAEGAITRDQADCVAEGFLDVLGLERLIEISQTAGDDPFAGMTSDEQTAVVSSMLQCVDAETLAEIGANPDG